MNSEKSPTPRTENKLSELHNKYLRLISVEDMPLSQADELQYKELSDFARTLERELAEYQEVAKELADCLTKCLPDVPMGTSKTIARYTNLTTKGKK